MCFSEGVWQIMDDKIVFRCGSRKEWRAWLEEHFETENEVWFVFPSKDSGEVGVTYNDAVEEALCFGWIDGRAGTLDKTHQLRRFTPRRPGSPYSQPNIERLILLDKEGKIHPKIRPSIEEIIKTPFVFPEDVLDAIRADGEAWKNYGAFSESYKRIRVAYIDAARRRPAEFEKRLANFIKKTRENKLIVGYGGVDKYYVREAKMFYETSDLKTEEIYLRLKRTCSAVPEKQYVPAYYFDICLPDGTKIGYCDLRIGYTDKTYIGGNIGYGIDEPYRGHRYAAKACALLFRQAKKHGMEYLTISCQPSNKASSRTCEIAGGTYVETADIPEDNEMYAEGKRQVMIYRFEL